MKLHPSRINIVTSMASYICILFKILVIWYVSQNLSWLLHSHQVRLYTSKRVLEELESAKQEYIQSTISVTKEQKILVPKIVDFFAKNSHLGVSGLMEMVKTYLPKASWKGIEFIPHDFTFHYLLSKELAW